MYVHRQANLAYLAHPRTASRSTGAALESIGFEKHRAHHGGPILKDPKYENLNYFTTVRNHWETFASWHMLKGGAPKEGAIKRKWISDWVARHLARIPFYCRPHSLFFFLHDIPTTVPIIFSTLEEDLNRILRVNSLPKITLPYISEGKRGKIPYQELFSLEAANFVAWYFEEEIDRFNFTFE